MVSRNSEAGPGNGDVCGVKIARVKKEERQGSNVRMGAARKITERDSRIRG